MTLFQEGKQVSTIRNYRSAISAIHRGFPDGSSVGTNQSIQRIIKGMFHKRPPAKPLPPSWTIDDVLTALAGPPYEPLKTSTLTHLTWKTLFLVAAASARRRSDLHALTIKPGFLRFEPEGVRLLPDPAFLLKNQTMSFSPEEIYLPAIGSVSSIQEDERWCPVRALRYYIKRTKPVRTGDRLFILPQAPYTGASRDTIARWIKQLIIRYAKPNEPVRAHDLRGIATSRAWFAGVPLERVMTAAVWKSVSTFVSIYLRNTRSTEGEFARAVLNPPRRQVRNPPPNTLC